MAVIDLTPLVEATPAGGVLVLGAGDYTLGELVVARPLSIVGVSPQATRLHIAGGATFGLRFDVPGLRDVRLENFGLDIADAACTLAIDFPRGVRRGRLSGLVLVGKGAGTGLRLAGIGPDGQPANNTYQTQLEGCEVYNFDIGAHFAGANASGARMNVNSVRRCEWTENRVHIRVDDGSSNTFDGNNFNPTVRGGTERVLITGPYGNNLFLGNYHDDLAAGEAAARHVGFAQAYLALVVLGDNQPMAAYGVIDPSGKPRSDAVTYAGMYQGAAHV
jgi:hypothetical protein